MTMSRDRSATETNPEGGMLPERSGVDQDEILRMMTGFLAFFAERNRS
jgi:hypothetical protein